MNESRLSAAANQGEVPLGLWPRVRARIRAAEEWEMPTGAAVRDRRMVDFWRTERGGWKGRGVPMLDVIDLYSPLRELDLLGRFIHLFTSQRPVTDKKIVGFYAVFGPAWEFVTADGERLAAWVQRLDPDVRKRLPSPIRLGYSEPMWWLEEKAQELRLTYDVYAALKDDAPELLRAILGGVPQGKAIMDIYIAGGMVMRALVDERNKGGRKAGSFSAEIAPAQEAPVGRAMRALTDDEARHWGRVVLTSQLNTAEARSSRRWVARKDILRAAFSEDGEPVGAAPGSKLNLVRVRGCEGLTTALYLHIADLIQQEAVLKHCPGCRRLFYRDRSDQIYCDPRCGDAARQRLRYAEYIRGKHRDTLKRRSRRADNKQRPTG